MQAEKVRRGRVRDGGALPVQAPLTSSRAEWQVPRKIRQNYLDALPIAAAVLVVEDEHAVVLASNKQYDALKIVSAGGRTRRLLDRAQLYKAITDFLAGTGAETRFNWRDGEVGGRHFLVCISRLDSTEMHARRCLLSLDDRTAEIEIER